MAEWEIKDLQAITFDAQDRSEFRYSRKNPTTGSVVIDLKDEQSGAEYPAVEHEDNIDPTATLKNVTIRHFGAIPVRFKVIATLLDAASQPKAHATAYVEAGILIERRVRKKSPSIKKTTAKKSPSQLIRTKTRPATVKKSKGPLKVAKKKSTS